VPLAYQAVEILGELDPLARGRRYLFPPLRTRDRPMSNNTINAALRRLGYSSEQQTGQCLPRWRRVTSSRSRTPPRLLDGMP